ncbi:ParA family protein [Pseudomonas chlororaphis]|uniref:Chromosome partitioning-like protein n=1 Tax=Pseudomonas chlororaphis TaxID=587753 RepID=A0AAX3FPT6_9PSED|nr:ParA family protein [Pseudomonas chlororaphis]AZC38258.1 Chromosome partitioning ATPase in PFGI-1-like cluster, ParA-like [Pseudomonas chlororaphis subsp. piscium]AZC44807.1 Chromosome partitioning ATPase in PFGI-1-like cluster, ParA-like [Pseudomonas chlororaphis subsp. piscium]WDG70411.1 ParA family protein [Pseudomonas chlororaphis]WDG77579.1 ParA family protein [Pseudomonas chlororaphis]WDG83183.1 ParA family protein [Pseudomonas chlororaphis]
MRVVSVISTKGGVGKTTVAANLGGLLADAGLRVLLLDLDSQPTLSSYYALNQKADAGAYEFIALNLTASAQIISRTVITGLDLILSNDDQGRLSTLLLHAPDGRLRLRNLLDNFPPNYDLLLIDTQGARSVLLEMAVLASDLAVSPITPEMLAARELQRGTLQLLSELEPFRHLGITPPPLRLLLNQVNAIRTDARMIIRGLRETFAGATSISILETVVPDRVAYLNAASLGLPVHRIETRQSGDRCSPSALDTMLALAIELFPEWHEAISALNRCSEVQ